MIESNSTPVRRFLLALFTALFIFATVQAATAQDSSLPDSDSPSAGDDAETAPGDREKREDILRYGIDSEVIEVLGNLRGEGDGSYNDLLTEVLLESRNTPIKQEIYRLWTDTEYRDGLPFAREELEKVIEDEDYVTAVVLTSMAFIAGMEDNEATSELAALAGHRNDDIAAAAVRAIGSVGAGGDDGTPELLLDRLRREDPVASEDLVAALIVTLGELRYAPAAEELVSIAEDEGASQGHRRLACVSIGKIGREGDDKTVERLYYESEDAMLRAYALAGFAEFKGRNSSEVLIRALKRDSFWRIRVTAAEYLATAGGVEVDELLRYKAANDPVNHVRNAALKSLGARSGAENGLFLTDYFRDSDRGVEDRIVCLGVLLDNRVAGTVEAVKDVMGEEWGRPGRFLEFVCRDLSRADWNALAPAYEQMLSHDNWLIQVYGIRGIRRNHLLSLQGKVNALDADGVDGHVRREVTDGR